MCGHLKWYLTLALIVTSNSSLQIFTHLFKTKEVHKTKTILEIYVYA